MRFIKLIYTVTLLLYTSIATATIIKVPQDQSSIQAGIDSALAGDTVLVDTGRYVENINFNGKNIVVGSLFLTTGDTSYISQTVIDGDSSGSVVTFRNGEDTTALLCGFKITNGYAHYEYGGGIYCQGANPSLVSLIVTKNASNYGRYGRAYGGGIYYWNSSSILIDVSISNNTATGFQGFGGGIYCGPNSNPSLTNVIVNGNYASTSGGGIYCIDSNLSLENVKISDNSVKTEYVFQKKRVDGGGGICCLTSNLTLENVIITDNFAKGPHVYGGGIYSRINSSLILKNVSIYKNKSYYGGGVYITDSQIIFDDEKRCNIFLNDAASGRDLYLGDSDEIVVVVDTFTVNNPTDYHAFPAQKFIFDILNSKIKQICNFYKNNGIEYNLFGSVKDLCS